VSPWIYRAFWVPILVWGLFGTAAALAAPDPTEFAAAIAFDHWQIRRAAARLAVAGFLLFAVWMIHRRARASQRLEVVRSAASRVITTVAE
jgi:hypothetical protein